MRYLLSIAILSSMSLTVFGRVSSTEDNPHVSLHKNFESSNKNPHCPNSATSQGRQNNLLAYNKSGKILLRPDDFPTVSDQEAVAMIKTLRAKPRKVSANQ